MPKIDLSRRLEALETEDQENTPVMVWVDDPADAEHLIAEAEQENPRCQIIAIGWTKENAK